MRITTLASGSSGNCTYVGTERTHLLIDCGITAKKTDEFLHELGLCLKDIDAVLLTHEHTDHIKGLKRLMTGSGIKLYSSEGTLRALPRAARDEYFSYSARELMHSVSADMEYEIGDIKIRPFTISHDAAQPLGFRLTSGDKSCAVATDLGYFNDYVRDNILGADAAVIEANHDRGMLANGSYPIYLKRRIMSREGHLSNNNSGLLISELLKYAPSGKAIKHIFLGHLSKENNTPELALSTVREAIDKNQNICRADELCISVAKREGTDRVIEF